MSPGRQANRIKQQQVAALLLQAIINHSGIDTNLLLLYLATNVNNLTCKNRRGRQCSCQ